MADFLHDDVLDGGLDVLTADVSDLYICSAMPATYAEASSTYALGTKATPTVGAAGAGDPDGREVEVSAITDGSVTGTDDAAYWALVDDTPTERLLAAGALSAPQAVTSGNTFTLTAFTVRFPDPA